MQKTQLALFPLQLFLLPGETTRLHIFEERYRQLLADCEDVQLSFGIPFTENGTLIGYGCMVKLKRVIKRHPNGSADIEIESTGIFELERFFLRMGEKLYPGGDVVISERKDFPVASTELFEAFGDLITKSGQAFPPESFDVGLTILDLARFLNLENSKKIKLLKLNSFEKRERFLMNEINIQLLLLMQKGSVVDNIFLN
jgi:hypothetical protein